MADVFISYSKKHRALTERIAALLERQEIVAPHGKRERLTVWWDTELLSGDAFHREITRQIDAARAVVVIWTEGSVESDWVYAEAQRGASQRKLVPLTERSLDRHKIPLPYSALHTDYADDDDAIVSSVMARLDGGTSEDIGALSDEQRWLLDPKTELPLPRTAKISPALLLQAKYRVVPFVDLDDRRAKLIDWALGRGSEKPQAAAGRVIHGPGGLGKTRLAIELISELTDQGWLAGFVNRGTLDHATRGPQLEHLVRTGRDARGLLLVVDYAEGRADEVTTLAKLLIERERAGGSPARLILLTRATGDWWRDLSGRDENVALLFGTDEEAMDTLRLADVPPGEARLRLWRDSAATLKAHLAAAGYEELASRDLTAPPDGALAARLSRLQQDPDYARPLAIQMETLLWLRGVSPAISDRGIAPMLDRMVSLERAHWKKVTAHVSENELARGVAQITAVQGVDGRDRAIVLLQSDNAHFGPRTRHAAEAIVRELSKLYGEEVSTAEGQRGPASIGHERLAALEPDLIGEHHVVTVADADLIDGCLSWIESEPAETQQKRRRDLLTVLQRATQPEHGAAIAGRARSLLDGLIRSRLVPLANDIVAVMIETPGALAWILDERLDRLNEDALAAIDRALPSQSLTLMELSLRIAERRANLARDLKTAADTATEEAPLVTGAEVHLAARLNRLGIRLALLGRLEEALAASQEAVDIERRVAKIEPDTYLPYLASSLNNVGEMLSRLRRHEGALIASQEAVEINRRLAENKPNVFERYLALSLDNLCIRLNDVRRHQEALVTSREAIQIFRRLVDSSFDASLDLARGLTNYGKTLTFFDQHEEALAATEEAVTIKRYLAQIRPDAFLHELAISLNNLSADLSILGRHEKALAASQEVVGIARKLAQTRPSTFLPDLAFSLGTLGQALASGDQHENAAKAWSEGLATIAPFVERHSQAFGDLARNLASAYLSACEKINAEPDLALLERIARALGEKTAR